MSPLAVAAVWAGAGVAGAAVLPALRLRRLALLIPVAGVAVVIAVSIAAAAVPVAAPTGTLGLDRVAQGLVAAAGGSLAAAFVLSPALDSAQMRTVGLVAAGIVIALASGSAIIWAVALLGCVCVLSLRWISAAPGRATFTAGRVAIPSAGALLAAAAFLPVAGVLTGPRPVLVSALLACGIAALAALLPLGGWSIGVLGSVPAVDSAAWAAFVAPAVLLGGLRLEPQFPPLALVYFEGILTVLGLVTASWQALMALRTAGRARYARILLADLALAATAIGTGHVPQALPALLLLTLTHLAAAPLLLQDGDAGVAARPLVWLLLCGLPPAPSFWGRFAVVEALSAASFWGMLVALVVDGMLFVAVLLAVLRPEQQPGAGRGGPSAHGAVMGAAGWCLLAGGVIAGLAPGGALTVVFGVR